MKQEFEMSMFGEIKFFVGLQGHQMKYGMHITQSKYVKEIPENFWIERIKASKHTYGERIIKYCTSL